MREERGRGTDRQGDGGQQGSVSDARGREGGRGTDRSQTTYKSHTGASRPLTSSQQPANFRAVIQSVSRFNGLAGNERSTEEKEKNIKQETVEVLGRRGMGWMGEGLGGGGEGGGGGAYSRRYCKQYMV